MASHSNGAPRERFDRHIVSRKCHDCGKSTTNYRCPACLIKWRRRHNIPDDINNILED